MAYYRASIGGGGVTPTSITPSNSSPVALTMGNAYEITNNNGYAIKSFTNATPGNTIQQLTSGTIYKILGVDGYMVDEFHPLTPSNSAPDTIIADKPYWSQNGGKAVASCDDKTPSNTSAPSIASGAVIRNAGNSTGYLVAKSPVSKTPNDSTHPSVSSGDLVYMGGSGYLYKTVQSGGGTLNSTVIDNNGSTFTSRSQYSVNVKNALPSVYNKLTLANFAVDGAIGLGSSTSAVQNDTALFLSYNASTGILSLGKRTTKVGSNTLNFTYKVRVFYVS